LQSKNGRESQTSRNEEKAMSLNWELTSLANRGSR
jgi:hypothetical protein